MSINRQYSPNHKYRDDWGRIAPNVEYAEGIRPPLGEAIAAPWLPVSRLENEIEAYFVISVGKVVALDRQGNCVPAGLRKAWNVAGGTTVLTYTATDVLEGVIDLTTGATVAAATSYTRTQLDAALKERGLIEATEQAMDFVSKPIGVASYNFYKAAGTDHYNPATLIQHNFRPQALVQVTADYACTYPLVPAVETTETMDGALANLAGSIDWSTTRTGGWFGSTALNGLVKYSSVISAGDDVVGYVFEKWPVAKITNETPITASVAGLTKEVSSVGAVSAAGDYFIDTDLGILFLYEAGGDGIPSPWTVASTITYYQYEDVVEAARVSTYACATGNIRRGDFLTYDANSNLVKAELDIANAEGYTAAGALYTTDPEYDTNADNAAVSLQLEQAISNWLEGIVGQVTGFEKYPKDYLDYTRTAYAGHSDATYRTPGTATEGRSDQLTYTNASDTMLIVNLIMR
jgi:hypothetical protein